jgi:hypothetical protein
MQTCSSFKSWKLHYVQLLFAEDCDTRMELTEFSSDQFDEWPQLLENISKLTKQFLLFVVMPISTFVVTGQK